MCTWNTLEPGAHMQVTHPQTHVQNKQAHRNERHALNQRTRVWCGCPLSSKQRALPRACRRIAPLRAQRTSALGASMALNMMHLVGGMHNRYMSTTAFACAVITKIH